MVRLEVPEEAQAARWPRSRRASGRTWNRPRRSYTRPRDAADSTHRREGAVRAAHPRARGALLGRPRVRTLHLRAGGRGVRARGRGVPRRAARDRRRERHRRARPRARGARDRRAATRSICPAFTFYATAEAIARVGATPVFADIDPTTLNLDPEDVAARITPRTKAIMPVHLFGRPAPLAELAALGLPLIEDAAQAFGAEGVAQTGHLLDVQLLPDEEPLRARRRRARHVPRRRRRRARADAALPRLARQEDLRARRNQLAARRRPGRDAARLPATAHRLERRAP